MKKAKNSLNYDSNDLIDSPDFKNQGNYDNHKNQGSDNMKGWEIKKLGDVCDVIGGGTPSKGNIKFYNGNIYWATVRDMKGDYISETEHKITIDAVKQSSTNVISKGNVVIATRVGLGKVCLIENDTAINQDLRGIVPKKKSEISIGYLFQWLKSISHLIIEEGTGATVQGVKLPFIKDLPIPLPPLPEQQRIVAILDEAFAAIAKAKANAQQNLQNAKELFESYLQGVFENGNWETKTIQEVTKVINGYAFASRDFKSTNTIKSIKITNVGVKEFLEEADNYLPEKFKDTLKAVQVKEGNIVIALTRTIISAGLKVAVVPKSYDGALVNQRVAALVPNEKIINQRYLYNFFTTDGVAKYVLAHVNTLMQPNLSINDLKNLAVPCPSLKTQQTIVQKLDALSAETKKLGSIYQQKINDLEELKKSVLQKAFSGELKTVRGEV